MAAVAGDKKRALSSAVRSSAPRDERRGCGRRRDDIPWRQSRAHSARRYDLGNRAFSGYYWGGDSTESEVGRRTPFVESDHAVDRRVRSWTAQQLRSSDLSREALNPLHHPDATDVPEHDYDSRVEKHSNGGGSESDQERANYAAVFSSRCRYQCIN